MRKEMMALLFLMFLLLVSAHLGEPEEEHTAADIIEQCTLEQCPSATEQLSDRGLAVLSQLPTFEMKMSYLGERYVLPNIWLIAAIILLLAAAIICWKFLKSITNIIIILVAAGAIILIIYSVFYYYVSGAEGGLIVCESAEKCKIAMHIHADLRVEICGKHVPLPLEKGDLSATHTHKEEDYLHWHDLTPIDLNTRELLEPEEMTLKASLEQLEIELPDKCANKEAETIVTVNGKEESLDYVWKDGDKIRIEVK